MLKVVGFRSLVVVGSKCSWLTSWQELLPLVVASKNERVLEVNVMWIYIYIYSNLICTSERCAMVIKCSPQGR